MSSAYCLVAKTVEYMNTDLIFLSVSRIVRQPVSSTAAESMLTLLEKPQSEAVFPSGYCTLSTNRPINQSALLAGTQVWSANAARRPPQHLLETFQEAEEAAVSDKQLCCRLRGKKIK